MTAEPISLHLTPSQLEAIDVWREAQPDQPAREDAVLRLIENALRIPETLDVIRQDVLAAYEAIGEAPGG